MNKPARKKLNSIKEFQGLQKMLREDRKKTGLTLVISSGTCGQASGSDVIIEEFRRYIREKGYSRRIGIKVTGCQGFCQVEPIVVIQPKGIFYTGIKKENVAAVVEAALKDKIVSEFLYKDAGTGKDILEESKIPFYKGQKRLVLGKNNLIDPEDIEDYIAIGGYAGLSKILSGMKPEGVIDEVKNSYLRGRGGGGYPTADKWASCRQASGDTKYAICNCDEGDPGAYMDRSLLEGNPHSVIEGIIIGAFAIGAKEGYIYVRHEYPLACQNAQTAINQASELGLLGKNILGSGFDFEIKVAKGGGAFVCGESTALVASLEGTIGEPRDKQHLHTTESGLWDKPTVLNNVETWANVPLIINNGAKWFYRIGTEKSKGTKIFSLVGKVRNTGLVEVPMGTTLKEIIFDIGGGPANGRKIKAVQTGGPSGGCLPAELFDLPVDYEQLNAAGSMMGSGGMIVMDEATCMVDVAKYFLNFLKEESCGKCLPCREGVKRMLEMVTDITEGRGKAETLTLLEELAGVVADTSLCGLGKTAPNPVFSTLRYFRDEYESHIKDKKCPAGVCAPLLRYSILSDCCRGCGACIKACPYNAISGRLKEVHTINQDICVKCGSCKSVCKFNAIQLN